MQLYKNSIVSLTNPKDKSQVIKGGKERERGGGGGEGEGGDERIESEYIVKEHERENKVKVRDGRMHVHGDQYYSMRKETLILTMCEVCR